MALAFYEEGQHGGGGGELGHESQQQEQQQAHEPPAEETVKTIRTHEVYERYGVFFEDFKGTTKLTITFFVASLLNMIIPAILLGIQSGGNMTPQTHAARITNILLLIVKAAYAIYIIAVRPFYNLVVVVTESGCAWLEAGLAACILALQYRSKDEGPIDDAMEVCAMAIMALQVSEQGSTEPVVC